MGITTEADCTLFTEHGLRSNATNRFASETPAGPLALSLCTYAKETFPPIPELPLQVKRKFVISEEASIALDAICCFGVNDHPV